VNHTFILLTLGPINTSYLTTCTIWSILTTWLLD